MDLMDTKEEAAFRDEIQTWMHETLDEYPEFKLDRDFSGTIDDQDWELRIEWEKFLGKAKWLGMSWPKEYGGRGADINKVLIFHEEYAKFGVPARANFFGEGLFAPTLLLNGTHEQKLHYLPRIQSGQDIWCQGYSEPNAGSDLVSARTNGKLNEAGEYIVNGQKNMGNIGAYGKQLFCSGKNRAWS